MVIPLLLSVSHFALLLLKCCQLLEKILLHILNCSLVAAKLLRLCRHVSRRRRRRRRSSSSSTALLP
jgi:hypothetical protein